VPLAVVVGSVLIDWAGSIRVSDPWLIFEGVEHFID